MSVRPAHRAPVARRPSSVPPRISRRAAAGGIPPNQPGTPPAKAAEAYRLSIGRGSPKVTANDIAVSKGVEAGKPLYVSYHRDLGVPDAEVDSVKLHYRIDGKEYAAVDLVTRPTSGPATLMRSQARVDIPDFAKGELEYWIETKTRDGKTRYDSNGGKNHHLNVVPASGLRAYFDDSFGLTTEGRAKAGETIRLNYDADRLRTFLGDQIKKGRRTFKVDAYVAFDGRPSQRVPIARFDRDGELKTLEAAIEVPENARSAKVWFVGRGAYDRMYDSAFGANYQFPVDPS